MDSTQFKEAAHAAIDEIIQYYDTIQDRRVLSTVEPGYLKKLLPNGPPERGEKWADIQKDIEAKIMPGLTHWQSPNFMAFFPASSSYPGMLGELYSSAFTAAAFNWLCSPAMTELETIVLDWLAELLALPPCYLSAGEGGGVIQGTASEAIIVVMVAARDRCLRMSVEGLHGEEREDRIGMLRGKLVALGSSMSHSSTQKAALIAGVRYRSVPVSAEDDFSMTGEGLRTTLEQCRRDGLVPFYLTTTMGTTSTCAVDKFAEIAEVVADYSKLWIHVDAAYAGSALVCDEYKHHAEHFGAFDSFNVNVHKWLLTNFDASCLYVKQRRNLIDALSITPSYLRNDFSDSGLVTDYRDWQMALGRRFRALKIWFVMRVYGTEGLKSHIRGHVKLGEIFHSLVASRPDLFKVLSTPAFALTVFNIVPCAVSAPKAMINNNSLVNVDGDCEHDLPSSLSKMTTNAIMLNGSNKHQENGDLTEVESEAATNGNGLTKTANPSASIVINGSLKDQALENSVQPAAETETAPKGNSMNKTVTFKIDNNPGRERLTDEIPTKKTIAMREISSSSTLVNGTPKPQARENGVPAPAESSSATNASLPAREATPSPSSSKPPLSSPLIPSTDLAATNALTKQVYELINSRGEIYLTSTLLDDVYAIRVVSANPKADEMHVRRAFEILVAVAEEVRSAGVEKLE